MAPATPLKRRGAPAMKALAFGFIAALLAILAWAPWGAGPASADGGPHIFGQGMTTDACAGCHRAHTARKADLLKADGADLCYTCHDGLGATTNVKGGALVGGGALRSGGFEQAWINTQDPTWSRFDPTLGTEYGGGATSEATLKIGVAAAAQPVQSKHSVDGSSQMVWGNGSAGSPAAFAGFKLECTSCHDPHGNGNYRILRPLPAAQGGAPDRAGAINIPDESPKVYTTTNYLDNGPGAISGWCSQCHTRYFAPTESGKTPLAGESVFAYRHTTSAPWAPSCVKCHAAHGSNAVATGYAAAAPWPGATGAPTDPAPGGSRLLKMDNRGICQKCHHR